MEESAVMQMNTDDLMWIKLMIPEENSIIIGHHNNEAQMKAA